MRSFVFLAASVAILLGFSATRALAYTYYDSSKCVAPNQVFVDQVLEVDPAYYPKHARNQVVGERDTSTCTLFSSEFLLHFLHNKVRGLSGQKLQSPSILDIIGQYKGRDLLSVNSGQAFEVLQKVRLGGYTIAMNAFENGLGDFERVFGEPYDGMTEAILAAQKGNPDSLKSWIINALSPSERERLKEPAQLESFEAFLGPYLSSPEQAVHSALTMNPMRTRLKIPEFNIRIFQFSPKGKKGEGEVFLKAARSWLGEGFPVELSGGRVGIHSTALAGIRRVCCGSEPGTGDCHRELRLMDSLAENQTGDHWYEVNPNFTPDGMTQILPCSSEPAGSNSLPECSNTVEGLKPSDFASLAAGTDDLAAVKQLFESRSFNEEALERVVGEAVGNSAEKVLDWLMNHEHLKAEDLVMRAVTAGKFAILSKLLERKLVSNQAGFLDHLALEAANRRRLSILKLLANHGANLNTKRREMNAIAWVVNNGDYGEGPAVVRYLIEKGVDFKEERLWGVPLLNTSAEYGYLEFIRIFCEAGADPSVKDSRGRNAYEAASQKAEAISREIEEESESTAKQALREKLMKIQESPKVLDRYCKSH